MKIREPLFSTEQHGTILATWYFSGQAGHTRVSRMPRWYRRQSLDTTSAQGALASLLVRWRAPPLNALTPWADYSAIMLSQQPAKSAATTTNTAIDVSTPQSLNLNAIVYANN